MDKIGLFSDRRDLIAPAICLTWGVLALVFIVGPGDATWQLYARELLKGHLLYSDLGFNQQPVFPLLYTLPERLFPGGILASKLTFLPLLCTFVLMLALLVSATGLEIAPRMLLMLASFFTAVHFTAYRFDDYHALGSALAAASILVSLRFVDRRISAVRFACYQAFMVALIFLTRINDGAALGLAAGCVFLLSRPTLREVGVVAVSGSLIALAVFGVVLLLIGETPATWMKLSVVQASSAKGGGSLLTYPGILLQTSLRFMTEVLTLHWLAIGSLCALLGMSFLAERKGQAKPQVIIPVVAAGLLLLLRHLELSSLFDTLAALGVALSFGGFIVAVLSGSGSALPGRPSARWTLLSYPAFKFLFDSLSSAGDIRGLYFPVAELLLVVACAATVKDGPLRRSAALRAAFVTLCAVLAWQGVVYRALNPYTWHAFSAPPFWGDYRYRNDKHGPYFIPAELTQLVDPVCTTVGKGNTLLSLPFSFANYYCGVDPWRGYVQTFYDTSTRTQIDRLLGDIRSAPPTFIFYQRQLLNLQFHEQIYNHNAPLPHRALDELIMSKLRSGEWTLVRRSALYPPSDWMLIRTAPAATPSLPKPG